MFIISVCLHAALFMESQAQSGDTVPAVTLRGVLPEDMSLYSGESALQCDGSRLFSLKDVNDNYCDCSDGKDEPGTSACSQTGATFSCLNPGFRSVAIPTSRVDDGICDCCDGSDEKRGLCRDSCAEQAAEEKARLERAISAFNSGAQVRRGYLTEAKKLRSKASDAAIERARDRVQEAEQQHARAQEDLRAAEDAEQSSQAAAAQELAASWDAVLRFRSLGMDALGGVLLALFDLTEATVDDVRRSLDALAPAELRGGRGGDDAYRDDHDYYNHNAYDEYAEDLGDAAIATDDGGEGDQESGEEAPEAPCGLLAAGADDRLSALCVAMAESVAASLDADEAAFMLRFVIHFVSQNRISHQFFIMWGYFLNYDTTFKSDQFYRDRFPDIDARLDGELDKNGVYGDGGPNMCPSGFRKVGWLCENADKYTSMMAAYDPNPRLSEAAEALRSETSDIAASLEKKREALQDLERLKEKLTAHADFAEFFALDDLCVSTVDGKFKYTLCVMKNVEQCELAENAGEEEQGHCTSSVSLGNFEKFEALSSGEISMSFGEGTHCHAFGARTSEVVVTCGPANVLLDATEPSTCFYKLHMESPAACNLDYAKRSGILRYIDQDVKSQGSEL